MTNYKYILNEQGVPVVEPDLYKWAEWNYNKDAARDRSIVKQEHFGTAKEIMVSTVFLGLNHNWRNDGPPILWETMVFGGPLDQEQDRCSGTREQAEAMHERMVKKVKGMK
jgi:hypothetical protein